ncbi:hypothetical protein CVT24_011133 [Panaeolus cyanescens]|uniref:DUS-like FMN-binding domain-containing protein n=1 Tax=Panaeolus cyanescens TaxID=181874 RepID=A0A409YG72_9AGAR|nr:hypothetical protein CVT24_011133 [Panaeolus cyanescens]
MINVDLKYVSAPMVNQSDLPFRLLVRKYGATSTYTQMYIPEKLLNDQDYLEYHIRDLTDGKSDDFNHPVVGQLCGNDPELVVQAARKIQPYCDAIVLSSQKSEHSETMIPPCSVLYFPFLVRLIVSSLSHSLAVPVSAKLRLCQPTPKTVDLSQRIEAAGASWITLHARTVSARRRRQGAADLSEVKRLKENIRIPVISNGNVRGFNDLKDNLDYTGADGLMVGETLLGNPW